MTRPLATIPVATCAICGAPYPDDGVRSLCWKHQAMIPGGGDAPLVRIFAGQRRLDFLSDAVARERKAAIATLSEPESQGAQ